MVDYGSIFGRLWFQEYHLILLLYTLVYACMEKVHVNIAPVHTKTNLTKCDALISSLKK